jgi:hypothetical protein
MWQVLRMLAGTNGGVSFVGGGRDRRSPVSPKGATPADNDACIRLPFAGTAAKARLPGRGGPKRLIPSMAADNLVATDLRSSSQIFSIFPAVRSHRRITHKEYYFSHGAVISI